VRRFANSSIRHCRGLAIAVTVTLVACGGTPTTPSTSPLRGTGQAAPEVIAYLTELLDLMQANALYRDRIDWPAFREHIIQRANADAASTIVGAHPAIQAALRLLGDRHSSYRDASGQAVRNPLAPTCGGRAEPAPGVPADIGYLRISAFSPLDPAAVLAHAEQLQQQIRTADGPGIVGWLVDLRGNGGGNMYPMLVGVGPILGDGVAGFFIYPSDAAADFGYRNGAAFVGGQAQGTYVSAPYRLLNELPRVAVLMGPGTASSGEAIVLAFRGRPRSRSFGLPTCGLATANRALPLSDGAVLALTTSFIADRDQRTFDGPIPPDEATSGDTQSRAIEWLRGGS
jgi:hypothetical protein